MTRDLNGRPVKRVLSLMGGGQRGIIPCCALAELEKQTGKLTRELFHFIGGTSTGALLSGSIAAGVPASESLLVYINRGREIFSPTNRLGRTAKLIDSGHQFDRYVLNRVVLDTLGAAASWTMNDCPIPVMITVGDQNGDPWYCIRDSKTNAGGTGHWLLADCMTASACATTYHAPWVIKDGEATGIGFYADGGTVSLADPVYQTCVEAFTGPKCYGDIDPADARVISLGTGYFKPAKMPDPPSDLLGNIKWVTSALVGSSKGFAAQAVERHWPGVLQTFNPELPMDIDEADVDQIPTLLAIGKKQAEAIDWGKVLEL